MKNRVWRTAVVAAFCLASALSSAETNIYLSLKGQTQGVIKGGVVQKGREGLFEVLSFNQQIVAARDAASGLATGKRQHKPIIFRIELGQGAPLIESSLALNENLTQARFDWFAPDRAGAQRNFYRVELVNAHVVGAEMVSAEKAVAGSNGVLMNYLEVTLTYQKITWTLLDPTTQSATDSWTG